MTGLFYNIWRRLGSIHLTEILCLSLASDLAYGYFSLSRHRIIFAPLNDIGLITWINTYGQHNLIHTAWFFILLGLLTLLCINTFVCTTERVAWLMQRRDHYTPQRLLFRLAPHVMHYAVIVILAGYLCSYIFAQALDLRTLIPGASLTLPGTEARITLKSFDPVYYRGDRLPAAFRNRVLMPRGSLLLEDGDHQQTVLLTGSRPVMFKGYGIFLKDFAPKKMDAGLSGARIDMIIRKDPGVRFYLAGIVLFTAGLVMYLIERILLKENKKEDL